MLQCFHIRYDSNTHANNCYENYEKVLAKLDKYLENPNEDNIHHIRTSLRRLEAAYQSSPKQIRNKKKIKKFASSAKKLFRINSKIRDVDIILKMLANEGKMPQDKLEEFKNHNEYDKQKYLKQARIIALDLRRQIIPNFYDRKKINRSFTSKSRKRLLKMVRILKTKIERKIPIVINNEDRILVLHELRKDTKKLRYLIELVTKRDYERASERSTGDEDSDEQLGENHHRILRELEKIQGMLGEIHDYDVTIDYLNQQHLSKSSLISDIIENMINVRKKRFNEFVDYNKPTNLDVKCILK
jgi:CHAD domain-containing protein